MSDHLHRLLAGDRFELKLAAVLLVAASCLVAAAFVIVSTWRAERLSRDLDRRRK